MGERRAAREAWLKRKPPQDEVFDAWTSNDLDRMLAAMGTPTHPANRHMLLVSIEGIAHRERNRDPAKRELLGRICELHISEFDSLYPGLRESWIGPSGNLVLAGVPTFAYLADLLIEDGDLDRADSVCRAGLRYELGAGTPQHLEKLLKKIAKARSGPSPAIA